ncbi:hypothetical protein CRE_24466 [Caenorhabditis remanei]|uniref:Uncharacterized protein n=1 Tax=Caenorhabditis remanei TaxID=31234 RepID=E3MFS7_CAERE|nr:hypothetical protein CRE_24466 [Caenorhabditis remanei]
MNSACERDADCDDELSCTLYFGEMMCRAPIKPLVPLRCESDAECPSTEYLCVFSTAMQDRVCYKYGDIVTDGYVIPIKHKISMEMLKTSTSSPPPTSSSFPSSYVTPNLPEVKTKTEGATNGLFAESEAIFEEEPGSLLTSTLQKRADDAPKIGHAPIYVKMEDGPSETRISGQHDGEAVRMTKVIVKEEEDQEVAGTLKSERVNIGRGVELVDDEPIDPMATVCQFDYHCRMGESCSGRVRFVDRNVTVCRYDILKKQRQCIYHSDCLSGQVCRLHSPSIDSPSSLFQRCTAKSKDLATCETDISATIGSLQCFYDYECSGGEKCTLVDEKERKFVCRPSPTSDPRMNQICTTNAQCPFQQVCRQSAGISLCVDVSISKNPAMLHERLWRFLRNFIFHRRR